MCVIAMYSAVLLLVDYSLHICGVLKVVTCKCGYVWSDVLLPNRFGSTTDLELEKSEEKPPLRLRHTEIDRLPRIAQLFHRLKGKWTELGEIRREIDIVVGL